MQHVDASTYWIAVSLVDDDGRDPAWVQMVVKAKGFGNIDIDAARAWLAANPKGCRCGTCLPPRPPPPPPRRVDARPRHPDLFG